LTEGASVSLAQRTTLRIIEGGPRGIDLEALVPSIAAGNEPAAARFYEATSGLLFGLLLLMLSDTATAEKVLLEVYAEVRTHAARFDRNQESLLIWLITIAHRRALEHLCSSSEDQQFLVSSGLADQRRSSIMRGVGIRKSAHRRLVGATLDGFLPAERKMIELAYFSRLTPRAIALKLRQSPAIVSSGLQSGISQLYNLFKNQEFLNDA
jgi:RNA polymerase sigma-70 factor (ECF subfamily)